MYALPPEDEKLVDTLELSAEVHRELLADLQRGFRAQLVVGLENQARIAKHMQEDQRVHLDGMGEQIGCIDPILYWAMQTRYGHDCWRNPAALRRIHAEFPETRMLCRARNLTLRVDGIRDMIPRSAATGGAS